MKESDLRGADSSIFLHQKMGPKGRGGTRLKGKFVYCSNKHTLLLLPPRAQHCIRSCSNKTHTLFGICAEKSGTHRKPPPPDTCGLRLPPATTSNSLPLCWLSAHVPLGSSLGSAVRARGCQVSDLVGLPPYHLNPRKLLGPCTCAGTHTRPCFSIRNARGTYSPHDLPRKAYAHVWKFNLNSTCSTRTNQVVGMTLNLISNNLGPIVALTRTPGTCVRYLFLQIQ